MGIAFDQAGGVIGSVHPDDFKKVYKKVIQDIVSGAIDTRKLNNSKAVHKYIADLGPSSRSALAISRQPLCLAQGPSGNKGIALLKGKNQNWKSEPLPHSKDLEVRAFHATNFRHSWGTAAT